MFQLPLSVLYIVNGWSENVDLWNFSEEQNGNENIKDIQYKHIFIKLSDQIAHLLKRLKCCSKNI